jgi:drug/metabolite transporter superfamily protein YnfA
MSPTNQARARAISLFLAAALCNILAGRVWLALSMTDPWWLGHAASLTIRAYGVDLAERTGRVPKNYRLVLHCGVMAVGWALDRGFEDLGGGG